MKKILKKIAATLFLGFLLAGLSTPTFAEDPYTDDLNDLKDRLETPRDYTTGAGQTEAIGIGLVDFSGKPWGNLPPETIAKLEEDGYVSLEELKEAIPADEDKVAFIEEIVGSNAEANRIYNEMIYRGESQVNSVLFSVIAVFRNLAGAIAVIMVVLAGIRMVAAQGEESKITEQKHHLVYTLVGLAAILLLEQLVYAIYGTPGTAKTITERGTEFSAEILGLVAYIKTMVAAVAVAFIAVSGVRMVTATGEEDKIKERKKGITWIIVGIIIILVNKAIIDNIFVLPQQRSDISVGAPCSSNSDCELPQICNYGFCSNPGAVANPGQIAPAVIGIENVNKVIETIAVVVKFALGFIGIVTLAVLVYGAGMLILNYSNEELVEKAKKIIKNALTGIVIILSAYAIISTLIKFS